MTRWIRGLAIALLVLGAGGRAAADGDRPDPPAKTGDADYVAAVKAIDAGRFAEAIPLLEAVVARDARNADAYNWLGYAVRRNGDPARAVPIYQKALDIDPKHRGAHEYIGEAYLMLGDVERARQHLRRLDALCFLPCSEYRDLKRAIETFEKTGQPPTARR
jgi:tetratricopeptide (TPR) repeat protein